MMTTVMMAATSDDAGDDGKDWQGHDDNDDDGIDWT